MSNCCLETKCMQCCKETNMVLSNHDVKKIKKKGLPLSFFIQNDDGWLRLKNAHGRCVFHNGKICTIYDNRPEGCVLYPVVYDKDAHQVILDKDCPQRHCFPLMKSTMQQLSVLISTLEHERHQRQHLQKNHLK